MAQNITIDGADYALESLSEEARSQIINLRVADAKLAQLQQEIALVQTARNAYARALAESLPKQ